MKKNVTKTGFFICLIVLIAGVILLAIPFSYEKFYMSDFSFKTFGNLSASGFDGTVTIENETDEDFDNVTVEFDYTVKNGFNVYTKQTKITGVSLKEGSNKITFRYQENEYSIYRLEDVSNVKLTFKNGKVVNAGDGSLFSGSNFFFAGMIIVGVIGSVVCLIMWKVAPKVDAKFKEEEEETGKTLEERIKDAFAPLIEGKNEVKEKKKYICPYCKVQYDADLDKCPHCGAPPERKG